MKNIKFLFIILPLMLGCSPKEVDIRELKFGESPMIADSIFVKKQQTTLVYHKGKKFSGLSIEKYGNGQLRSKLEIKDGLADGTQEAFYLNGNPRFYCNFIRGHLIKEFKQFFENGNIKRIGNYNNNGLLDGIATVYNEDGSVRESVSLKEGDYDGPYVEYFANGKVYRKFNYVKGIKEGDAEVFNEDGSTVEKVVFSNGVIKESTSEEPSSSENTSTKSTIAIFQNALNALGYSIPEAKGTLDATTKEQLKSFQEDYQLETSIGKIDVATAKMLVLALKQKDVQGTEQLQRDLNSFSTTSSAPTPSNSGNDNSSRMVSCQSISDNPQNFIGRTITLNLGYASSLNGRRSLKGGDIEEEKTFSMAVISVYDGNDEYYSRIGDCSGGTNLVLRIPHRLVVPNIISGYIKVTGILKDQYTLIVKSISR